MITLIATGHKEIGICNSIELYKIIEQIAPEVIFEEVPPCKFAAVYNGTRNDSLETNAIKMYLKEHPIVHIPVDMDIDGMTDKRFKGDSIKMAFVFNNYSPEYKYLTNQLNILSEQFGFSFLNSDSCSELSERKRFLEETMLIELNHEKLSQAHKDWLNQAYKDWLKLNSDRRNEMIKNINSYSCQNKYERALFLIGAAHRKPIMDKIQKLEKNNEQQLNWNFDYFK